MNKKRQMMNKKRQIMNNRNKIISGIRNNQNNKEKFPVYPILGTDEERKTYFLYFNEKLKEKCIQYNYIFFDIYNKYCDDEGFLKKELSDNGIHIGNGIYITEFIKNNLL